MYGIILIAVLAAMGGAIAFIGDKLGTKVGKRRLTIFGLRPKHTSILVTIITGILIASCTLGILTLASRDVRTALFGMEALKNELAVLSSEVTVKNTELKASRDALEAKNAEYSTLNARIQATAEKLKAVSQELSLVTSERDRTIAALQQIQIDYAEAERNLESSQQQIQSLQATKAQLDGKITTLNEAKNNLQTDVDRLNELTDNLKKGLQVVRQGSIIFRAGEVLSTTVLASSEKRADTENALAHIIYRTNQSVLDRLNIDDRKLEVLWIARSDFDQAVDSLAAAPEGMVVRISSAGNTVYGEPIIGHIELFPNHLIYSQGTTVYSEIVDVGGDATQTEETVLVFLQKVNAIAIKQGILPDPLQGTVGEMSGAQLYATINQVKRNEGKVELSAIAKNDINAVGPLKIEIRVRNILN